LQLNSASEEKYYYDEETWDYNIPSYDDFNNSLIYGNYNEYWLTESQFEDAKNFANEVIFVNENNLMDWLALMLSDPNTTVESAIEEMNNTADFLASQYKDEFESYVWTWSTEEWNSSSEYEIC